MKKIKKKLYPYITIVFPLLLIIIVSVYLSLIFEIINYEGKWFLIKLSEVSFNHPRRLAFILLFIIQFFIMRKTNKEKEYAPTDIYGDYHIAVYYIAWLLLGYKKVNLKSKPIPLQFQLLNNNNLECFDDTEYSDIEYEYKITHEGTLDKNTKQINIIVADTHPITLNKIPKQVTNNYTINISRKGGTGIRIKSQKLIQLIIKEVQKSKKYCKEYNLFLSTPATTNKRIFCQVFQTYQRDKFIINVYQQDSNNNYKFLEKSIKIKC